MPRRSAPDLGLVWNANSETSEQNREVPQRRARGDLASPPRSEVARGCVGILRISCRRTRVSMFIPAERMALVSSLGGRTGGKRRPRFLPKEVFDASLAMAECRGLLVSFCADGAGPTNGVHVRWGER